jgi:uncharacterized protein YjiS (DUF1127 family)
MSYIDAKWEEPNLLAPTPAPRVARGARFAAWVSRQITDFVSWVRESQAAAELSRMSDYELSDIGLSRADINRVFKPDFNADLQQRGIGR